MLLHYLKKAEADAEGFNWLKTHPHIMKTSHNQQFSRAWLIIVPQTYHDNWSVLDEQ